MAGHLTGLDFANLNLMAEESDYNNYFIPPPQKVETVRIKQYEMALVLHIL
jgi:hypothetical protein